MERNNIGVVNEIRDILKDLTNEIKVLAITVEELKHNQECMLEEIKLSDTLLAVSMPKSEYLN